jgi:hypothetical protein
MNSTTKVFLIRHINLVRKNQVLQRRLWLGLVLIIVGVWSCNGRPARKKLPDIAGDQASWEGVRTAADRHTEQIFGLPPFYVGDTTLRLAGRTSDLLAISLPEPAFDSLAVQLVATWSPMARTLMDRLAARGDRGVLIDLRTGSSRQDHPGGSSTTYRVDRQEPTGARLTLPVVFCWDLASTARAMAFIDALREIPGFRYIWIDGRKDGRQPDAGCFSADPPTNFDQQ